MIRVNKAKTTRTALSNYNEQRFLTTGDAQLDEVLGGGAPLKHITEFVGESGVGKSQFMTQFCITTQLAVHMGGLDKEVVYISTESGLATSRAQEITEGIRKRYADQALLLPDRPLDRIHVVVCPDLELQDHMLYYQLPVLLKHKRGAIGSVIIDSVAANYRAEHSGRDISRPDRTEDSRRAGDMGVRTRDLLRLAAHLRGLAVEFDLAVIVANQVSDRIDRTIDSDILALDHQSQWFNGWRSAEQSPKVPALGLVWANSVHCRVALKKVNNQYTEGTTDRELSIVYSPFAKPSSIGLGYKIDVSGVHSR